MLRHILISLILILFATTVLGQNRIFHAEFRSLYDGERILYAKINNGEGQSKLTNSDGYVNINYSEGSVLTVTHVSYDTLKIDPMNHSSGDTILFYMAPKTYELREFQYSVLGPRSIFDNKFVDTDLGKSDIEKVKEKLDIEDMTATLVALDRSAADGVRLGSPITALYDQFSKEGRERRRYLELLANDTRDSVTREKYNLRVVQSLTAIIDTAQAQDFMDFCSFDKTYIEQTEKVEIFYEILRCKQEYERIYNEE